MRVKQLLNLGWRLACAVGFFSSIVLTAIAERRHDYAEATFHLLLTGLFYWLVMREEKPDTKVTIDVSTLTTEQHAAIQRELRRAAMRA